MSTGAATTFVLIAAGLALAIARGTLAARRLIESEQDLSPGASEEWATVVHAMPSSLREDDAVLADMPWLMTHQDFDIIEETMLLRLQQVATAASAALADDSLWTHPPALVHLTESC